MAAKAKLFEDQEILEQILKCDDPKQIKALGRKVKVLCGADIMTEMRNQNAVRRNVDSNIIIRKKINPVHLWEMLERSTLLILQKNSGLIVRIKQNFVEVKNCEKKVILFVLNKQKQKNKK